MSKKIFIVFFAAILALILAGCTYVNSSTHTISGYVKDALGNGVANVTISISYPNGYLRTSTDKNGHWSERGVIGKTTITPSASGWTFNPKTKILNVDRNYKDVDFTANPLNYWVSGYVRDEYGNGISGVTITFESSQIATSVKTNLNGFWKSGMLRGTVKVKPLKNGWLFSPSELIVNGLKADVNFIASKGVGERMYIPLKGNPAGLAVDEGSGKLYVSDSSTDLVTAFNVYGYNKLDEYKVGPSPAGMCYDPNHKRLFVANSATNTITVIDASNDKVIENVLIGGTPHGMAFNSKTNFVYVTNSYFNAVNVLSASPVRIVGTIRVGKSPQDVTVNPVTNMIYVTNQTDGSVSVINGKDNSLSDEIKVGGSPLGIAVNPVTNMIYVANHSNNTLDVINGETDEIVKEVQIGNGPSYVYVDTQKNRIYVSNTSDNTISVVDGKTNTVLQTVLVGKGPTWISGDEKIGVVYVSNTQEKTVSVVH